ncbi:MAG: hypothetical protein ACTSWQ_10010 [Candidatus Thorarchaeota archaeon]
MTLIQSSVGRFDVTLTSVMNDIRQPVFVDNAVHYAKIQPQNKVTIEARNAENYDLGTEKAYSYVDSESSILVTHKETDGHSDKSGIWFSANKDIPSPLMYSFVNPMQRLIGSTYTSTSGGLRIDLRNMRGKSVSNLGFEGDSLHFGQIIDVGFRTTDLAMRLGNDISESITAMDVGNSPTVANIGGNRRKVSNVYLAADFNNVNLMGALRYVSRHDNRISLFNRYGVLQYVPFNFSSGKRVLDNSMRLGNEDKSPVENTENRITVQGIPMALNENLTITMDDAARQQGKYDTDILENVSPIFDASIKNTQDAKKVARQILKANSIMKGAITTEGHPDAWDLRPGDFVQYGTSVYVVMKTQHKLSDRLSNFKFLTLDTGIEGVLRKIGAGSISESSTKTPEKTNQIKDENLSFFENLDVHAVPIIELRHVSSIGFLIGKNASRGRIGKNYEPMGLNKGDAIVLRGDM